ncbi:SIMPL domain-containing protein [Neisseria gonorrhoeae]
MLRSILAASLLAVSFPAAAEAFYNIVEFSESAGIEVAQDTMSARFQVAAEGRDKNAVNAEFVKKFNNFTRKSKNGSFKTELVSRSAMPRYQYTNGRRIQTGWEERAEFKAEGRDFDALNRFIADVQTDASLEDTDFSVSRERRNEVIDQVSKDAVLRFKARAEKLAGVLGASGYKIVKLNFGQIGSHIAGDGAVRAKMLRAMPMAASVNMKGTDSAAPGVEEISISINGTVQF